MDKLMLMMAGRIPEGVRKIILEEGFIGKATNTVEVNTPMEFLFDVYAEFLDARGEFDDWTCFKCRQHVLDDFIKLQPFLNHLNNGN